MSEINHPSSEDHQLPLVDAHMHLSGFSDPETELRGAEGRGMLILTASTNERDARGNLELRRKSPSTVRFFAGIHPSDVDSRPPRERLAGLLDEADGIGEIGLDPKYSEIGSGSLQMTSFLDQLELAERLGRPVQVHTRDSEGISLEKLSSYGLKRVLLHWFEGEELVRDAASRGCYVSFGPALLYSKKLQRMARSYPANLVLTESDGPVTYAPLGGRVSGSTAVASVVFCLSELLGEAFGETEERTYRNALEYLSK